MAMENIAASLGVTERSQNEGIVTSKIEHATANVPSIGFLLAAGASVLTSGVLFMMGRKEASLFVGEWVPSLLLLGVYNKIVKATEPIQQGAAVS